jgi:hypothetical protein
VGNTLACITGCVLSGPTLLALLLALC